MAIGRPAALTFILVKELMANIETPYEGYPTWMLGTLGWGVAAAVIVLGFLATLMPWRDETYLGDPEEAHEAREASEGRY